MMTATPLRALTLFVLLAAGSTAAAQAPAVPVDLLSDARRAYNEERYDDVLRITGTAREVPALAPAAGVIGARAGLERFRLSGDHADLDAAREALKAIDVAVLSPRDQVEFAIALGESLYLDDQYEFDDRYSAAAEQFDLALGRGDLLDEASRDRLFEWWALSVDHQAQLDPASDRRPAYERIVARAERELARSPGATSAAYWLAAGARGVDDLPRAWGAAVAGWVRAGATGSRGEALREDLERLIVQVILPERARQLAAGGDPRPTLSSLLAQWEQIKDRWK
jgi:hypothetical protein